MNAPTFQVLHEDVKDLLVGDVVGVVHGALELIQVHVDIRAPMHQETELLLRYLLHHLLASTNAPATGNLRIGFHHRLESQSLGLAQSARPVALGSVEHHLVLHHHGAPPHGCVNLLRLLVGAIRPVGEATADLALVIPGDHLGLARLPVLEQARLDHGIHQPDRRIVQGETAEARGIDMGVAGTATGALNVEQHAIGLGILGTPVVPHQLQKLRIVEAVLDLRLAAHPAVGVVAAEYRAEKHVQGGLDTFRQRAGGGGDELLGGLEVLGDDQ